MIIYKITFPNKKIYIGQSVYTLNKRKSVHLNHTKNNSKTPVHCAIRFYGIDNITWEVVDTATTLEELNQKETYWIKTLNSICESDGGWGYNITYGGDNRRHSLESRKKMSDAKKGKRFLSKEHYNKLSKQFSGKGNPFYGKKVSKENKIKLKNLRLNTKLSEKTKNKMSIAKGVGPILVYKKITNEYIGEFSSASECARKMKLNVGHICSILRGNTKLKSHKGYIFKKKEM